jgi:hypothetical protein
LTLVLTCGILKVKENQMKLFSTCSDCETCKIHYYGGCLAGHGDDDYDYASPEWIENFRRVKEREKKSHDLSD